MSMKMLIDAAHPEETRVAVIDSKNKLIEYDFESSTKQTFKGNIYLAKVARVEPSLQAAFVDFGGNRHGFLAFSEIHPDYFRIPVADRERLEAEMNQMVSPLEDEEIEDSETEESSEKPEDSEAEGSSETPEKSSEDFDNVDEISYTMPVASLGGELPLAEEEEPLVKRPSLHKRYKIQEVIHKNQILLIQVAKEERSGKGAALTTYLSLAGRYCVLMPNSPRSGGISRKISSVQDRKRLRKILDSLEVPDGMGLIVRTAGKERIKTELKRDTDYLMRLWNTIREGTLNSTAPAMIYEEDDIIKRAIRDLYTKDIDEVLVEGEDGHKVARSFMKTLMPSHLKKVHLYTNQSEPLFFNQKVEKQINEMHSPSVELPSGGSIVIHPTEALVSIDINSGRANRGRHIEETATNTNLEAAQEIARQVRLRDLAGLIVIDFIDMEKQSNIAAVERKVRESLRHDRARIQVGKISPFGLLELSRQRLRPSILETSAHPCSHCQATGYIRSVESMALEILRVVEEERFSQDASEVLVQLPTSVSLYILNQKRPHLSAIEARHQLKIFFENDDHMEISSYKVTRLKKRSDSESQKKKGSGSKGQSKGKSQGQQKKKKEGAQETGTSGGRRSSQKPEKSKAPQESKKTSPQKKGSDTPGKEEQKVEQSSATEGMSDTSSKAGSEGQKRRRTGRHWSQKKRGEKASAAKGSGEEKTSESGENKSSSTKEEKTSRAESPASSKKASGKDPVVDLDSKGKGDGTDSKKPTPKKKDTSKDKNEGTSEKKKTRTTWWKKILE